MRVMTLAEDWIRIGGGVVLLSHELPAKLTERAEQLGIRCVALTANPGSEADRVETSEMILRIDPLWLVIDGYDLHTLIPQSREEGFPEVLAFDDFSIGRVIRADLVVDQNAGTIRESYKDYSPKTKLLLGGSYCLIRGEFRRAHKESPHVATSVERVLMTFGGADPSNATTDCIRAFSHVTESKLRIDVVVGATNPRRAEMEAAAAESPHEVVLLDSVSNMAELMSHADLAIAGPGVTCWELAYIGVPMLLVTLAENQQPNAEYLERTGVARCLGDHATTSESDWQESIQTVLEDADLRAGMVENGRQLIDGLGTARVCRHLRESLFRLRAAESADARMIWEWSNEPETRKASFSSDLIPWETHVSWFEKRLADQDCQIYLASDNDGIALGQVRFETTGAEATISISLDADARGHGWGTQLIWMACRRFFSKTEVDRIEALIKPDNGASIRAFEKAEFVSAGRTEVKQQPARRFVLDRGKCL